MTEGLNDFCTDLKDLFMKQDFPAMEEALSSDGVIIAEGNYNSSIHWGRIISYSELQKTGTCVMTRYPE